MRDGTGVPLRNTQVADVTQVTRTSWDPDPALVSAAAAGQVCERGRGRHRCFWERVTTYVFVAIFVLVIVLVAVSARKTLVRQA